MERFSPSRPTGTDPHALLESQVKRLQRVVTFSEELALALRREFAPLWDQKAPAAKVQPFVGKVESVLKWVGSGKQLLERQQTLPPLEALKALGSFPTDKLVEETRGLNALAKELRDRTKTSPPMPKANVTRPLSEADATDNWTGWFRKLVKPTSVKDLSEAPAPAGATEVARKRQAFESVLDYASQLLAFVSPRMTLIRAALLAAGIPGPQRPWSELMKNAAPIGRKAGIPPGQVEWVPVLAELFHSRSEVAQKAQVLEHQFKSINELLGEAEILKASLGSASPEAIPHLLEQFHVERFKGMLIPLTNVHFTFKGISLLETLFPPPPRAQ